MRLNDAQREAAESLAGLVVVDAGAGSGKTRALTQRFVNAVDTRASLPGWSPTTIDRLVAITFTDKAAGELAERIREMLRLEPSLHEQARRVDVAWISTIHSFCSRLLRDNALLAGVDPQFGVVDAVTAGELAEECFETAARAGLERDPNVGRLFGEYGYRRVFDAVTSVNRELIKRGLPADVLDVEPVVEAAALLGESLAVLRTAAERLDGCADPRSTVSTGAGLCRDLCERLGSLDARTADSAEIGRAVWTELRTLPKSVRLKNGEAALVLAELVAERRRLRADALTLALQPYATALATLVDDYDRRFAEAKSQRSLLDFDDLQLRAYRLLSEHEHLAEAYREQFGLVMVDEFQDTDSLQLGIVRAISGPNLCTVGDERQSIYRFRGAEVEVYREHRDQAVAAGIRPITFSLNYRSHPAVLAFVNRVFGSSEYFAGQLIALQHGREEPEKPMLPVGEPRVELLVVERPSGSTDAGRRREAYEVAARFAWLRDEHGVEPSQMTVLVRSWSRASVFAEALRARGFAVIVGGGDFLSRPEVQLVRALIAAIASPHDEQSMLTVLASPLGGLSADALWMLARDRSSGRTGLWDAMRGGGDSLPEQDRLALARVVAAISGARACVGSDPLGEIVLRAVTQLGYDLVLLSNGPEGKQQFVNVLKVARLAEAFEQTGQTGIASFVAHLDAKEQLGDRESVASLADDGSPAVRIMSIHGAKGLEFPVVAVVGLADGTGSDTRFVRTLWVEDELHGDPHLRVALRTPSGSERDDVDRTAWFEELDAAATDAEFQEEKRLAYVAATRAKDYLLLSGGIPLERLQESTTTLASIVRGLGALDALATGVDAPVDFGGFEVRLRRVDAVEPDVSLAEEIPSSRPLGEAELVFGETAGRRGPGPRVEEVSFSSLKLYETCPRRYWSERVAKLGWAPSAPEEPGSADAPERAAAEDALAFGSAVHAALQEAVERATPSAGRLEALADAFALGGEDRERLRRAVEAALGGTALAAARSLGRMRAEVPFTLPLGSGLSAVRLSGSIDLYVRAGRRALIVDYKTGTAGGPDEVRERYGLQARCYALAALFDGASHVEALYVRPEVAVGSDVETTTFGPFGPDDIPRLEAEVLEVVGLIRDGRFPPHPSSRSCTGCAIPRGLCPEAWSGA